MNGIIFKDTLKYSLSIVTGYFLTVDSGGKMGSGFQFRNYIEIYTASKMYLIRKKLDDFYHELPDILDFVKVHRSYYIRLDKVSQRNGLKEIIIFNTPIPVSKTCSDNLKFLSF
ncbi:LytTR family DNA-binding domain-containing protein [uncultured Dokdonia sp.]|uniref:LytTR family DNA-binding domain-containing protein n=1 Tax=uncultured Dokdonia sp. TaxID=575653 RepID=UPI002604ACD8|nr:LytTR family DNA-binding domain-containing protein [uncultured Dokdonia sp.]